MKRVIVGLMTAASFLCMVTNGAADEITITDGTVDIPVVTPSFLGGRSTSSGRALKSPVGSGASYRHRVAHAAEGRKGSESGGSEMTWRWFGNRFRNELRQGVFRW